MEGFFQARSVAVIGVSNSPTNLGRAMVYNLMEFRFQGVIHLVGPKGGSFFGHKIYPSGLDIPDPVDLGHHFDSGRGGARNPSSVRGKGHIAASYCRPPGFASWVTTAGRWRGNPHHSADVTGCA